jgi:hypothetical protein
LHFHILEKQKMDPGITVPLVTYLVDQLNDGWCYAGISADFHQDCCKYDVTIDLDWAAGHALYDDAWEKLQILKAVGAVHTITIVHSKQYPCLNLDYYLYGLDENELHHLELW